MSNLITVRLQIGLDKLKRFPRTVPQESTVDDLRRIIRRIPDANISPSDGVVLISNGQSLKNPTITLIELGLCNDSLIICVISKETGREIEKLLSSDEDTKYKDHIIYPVLDCVFTSRPFGFAVWANERGENAIVTKVVGRKALELGVQIGYCVYKVNNQIVFNQSHEEILGYLKNMSCPLRATFVDLGREYTVSFQSKPLGFTVVQDNEGNNARVSKINIKRTVKAGVKIGSYIIGIHDLNVFGLRHLQIINIINKANFPIIIRFRRPPKLLIVCNNRIKRAWSS